MGVFLMEIDIILRERLDFLNITSISTLKWDAGKNRGTISVSNFNLAVLICSFKRNGKNITFDKTIKKTLYGYATG